MKTTMLIGIFIGFTILLSAILGVDQAFGDAGVGVVSAQVPTGTPFFKGIEGNLPEATPTTVDEKSEDLSLNSPVPCVDGKPEICFGDYYKVLTPKTTYVNKKIVPDTIIIHTDDQSGNTPEKWFSTTTWNGLSGRDHGGRSTHFGVGLDGVGQFLPMYQDGVIQCRGAGVYYDRHSIEIEMAGRWYDYMLNGKASDEMAKSIQNITAQTLDLTVALMKTYDISIDNVIGHYEIVGSGKTDPGKLYFETYFLPLLEERTKSSRGE